MLHKVISAAIALLFLVLVRTTEFAFRIFLPVMLIYAIVAMAYNYWYMKKRGIFSFWRWPRFLFLLGSLLSIYFALPDHRLADLHMDLPGFFKGVFMIVAVFAIYVFEFGLHVISEQRNFLVTLFSYFGTTLGIFALNFFFLPKSAITSVLLGLSTFLICRSSFEFIPQTDQKKSFFSWIIALAVMETSWAVNFLPFHYTVNAVIAFNTFYVLWIVIYYYFYNNLTLKKIYFHVIFSAFLVVAALLSTPWK